MVVEGTLSQESPGEVLQVSDTNQRTEPADDESPPVCAVIEEENPGRQKSIPGGGVDDRSPATLSFSVEGMGPPWRC